MCPKDTYTYVRTHWRMDAQTDHPITVCSLPLSVSTIKKHEKLVGQSCESNPGLRSNVLKTIHHNYQKAFQHLFITKRYEQRQKQSDSCSECYDYHFQKFQEVPCHSREFDCHCVVILSIWKVSVSQWKHCVLIDWCLSKELLWFLDDAQNQ